MINRKFDALVVNRRSATRIASKLAFVLSVAAMLSSSVFVFGQAEPCTAAGLVNTFGLNCAFYGGDFNPSHPDANGLSNENDAIVSGNPYGAATFQNFNWNGGAIDGLFTNNLSGLNPTSAYWEVRTGVSQGNGGTLLASGTTGGVNFRHTPTGNSAFGFDEYTDAVLTPGLSLLAGKYWFSVVPYDPTSSNRSFNTNTFVSGGAIGSDVDNDQYWDSPFFGANFDNANNSGVFQDFSSGVLQGSAPEPSSLLMLGSGLVGIGGLIRRRLVG